MKFALVGNPNCGKTTLFNGLTGSSAHVGNWPGVTVDLKTGTYKNNLPENVEIVDLPGVYSLSPYSPEEVVARNFILDDNPDLIINIVDATNLERNLYLTTQLMETDCPIIVALNMMDLVKKNGTDIDIKILEKELGVPVVTISALRSEGFNEVMEKAYKTAGEKNSYKGNSVVKDSFIGDELHQIVELFKKNNIKNPYFNAVKIIEGDLKDINIKDDIIQTSKKIIESIELDSIYNDDFEAVVADARYKYITKHYTKAFKNKKNIEEMSRSDKIDMVLTHKYFGIPIFLSIMLLVFHLTFSESLFFITNLPSPGVWMAEIMESIICFITDLVANGLVSIGADETTWVYGLLIDGLFAGVGAVLGFLPLILLLYLFLSIMEDSGYMARAAFLMDGVFRHFGLSGKAFIPLLMGFGCSVPAITATRTLESEKDRKLTIMMMTGFSCGAKLPIWTIFATAFFPAHADLMVFGIYIIGIVVMMIVAYILKKTVFKGENAPFIMELPSYHLPQTKNTLIHLWQKCKDFLLRASTIIAGSTIIIWFLSNFNFSLQMVEANSKYSMLGTIGSFLRPLFIPLGFASDVENGWKAIVAIITGLIAKEMVVASMGVLYQADGFSRSGLDAIEDDGAQIALISQLPEIFSPLGAISFMIFNLLCTPCMAAIASARIELKSKKWTFIVILFWLLIAYLTSLIFYQTGNFINFIFSNF